MFLNWNEYLRKIKIYLWIPVTSKSSFFPLVFRTRTGAVNMVLAPMKVRSLQYLSRMAVRGLIFSDTIKNDALLRILPHHFLQYILKWRSKSSLLVASVRKCKYVQFHPSTSANFIIISFFNILIDGATQHLISACY